MTYDAAGEARNAMTSAISSGFAGSGERDARAVGLVGLVGIHVVHGGRDLARRDAVGGDAVPAEFEGDAS